jgi:hypothetical protein
LFSEKFPFSGRREEIRTSFGVAEQGEGVQREWHWRHDGAEKQQLLTSTNQSE